MTTVEIRLNDDGTLDEVCTPTFHLEQMDDNFWWMEVSDARGRVVINLQARGRITAYVEDERGRGNKP